MTLRLPIRLTVASILAATALSASAAALWLDVPFVRQPPEGCGAAAISMILKYWTRQDGLPAAPGSSVDEIQAALYVPEAGGIPASAMRGYFKAQGYRTFAFRGEWADLAQHLGRGRPLVAALGPGGSGTPLHYVVVAGVDPRGYVYLNDPARGKLVRASRDAFTGEWNAAGNWTLLALPWPAD